jgi:poly(3-hydroxybutyrate) depolymerase
MPEQLPPDTLPPGQAEDEAPAAPAGNERAQAGSIELKIPEFENDAWAYVPEHYRPAERCGLVVWLQAPGKFDWQETLSRWKPHCDAAGLILLAPEPADPKGWRVREATLVRKLIDELESTYTVDPSRVVIHGHRAGGKLAYLVAFSNRDVVQAVAAVEAPLSVRPPENDPLYPVALYLAWAKKTRDADRIQAGVTRLRQMEYPVTVKDCGDEPRYLNPDELSELVRWIDMLDRI